MTACERYQSWQVEALYDELDDARRAELDVHLGTCADCAALFSELRTTADLMHRRRRPDPGPEFWEGFGRRLEARIAREDSLVVDSRRRSLGSWGYRVAAVVAILAVGAWIGRTLWAPTSSPDAPQVASETARDDSTLRAPVARDAPGQAAPADSRVEVARTDDDATPIDAPPGERATSAAETPPPHAGVVLASNNEDARRYIDRSQLLLLAVLNADPGDVAYFDEQKARAGELVRTASSVREGSDDRRVQELVVQLEFILREIAHLEAASDVEAVEVIRSRVNREGVLLRINIEQMRAAQAAPAPDNDPID